MNIKIFQVDAFTDQIFSGNPASVCALTEWLPDPVLQNIAMENNQAETAFFLPEDGRYNIRWFTPTLEVDLCGHATLAAAHVLFHHLGYDGPLITFLSPRSGILSVRRQGQRLTLNFPTDTFDPVDVTPQLTEGFNIIPKTAYKGKTDYMFVYDHELQIRDLRPDFRSVAKLSCRGVIVTAPGEKVDFVSRFFAPQSGINEDPVTGSAHTTLTPFWASRLSKTQLTAIQLSSRKGYLHCENFGSRVELTGEATTYMEGQLHIRNH